MSLKDDLLAAIWDQPHADHPRLVYADWLEEQGDAARAEFIRLQCEHFRMEKYEDAWYALGDRIEKLWQKHKKTWQGELPASVNKYRFERGFVAPQRRDISGARFMALTPADLAAAPLWRYAIKSRGKTWIQSCMHANAGRLQDLHFNDDMSATKIDDMFDSRHLRNLQVLTFAGESVTDDTVKLMCGHAAYLTHLTELNLWQTSLSDNGLQHLSESQILRQFHSMRLDFNKHTASGIEALASTPSAAKLRTLEARISIRQQPDPLESELRLLSAVMNSPHWTQLSRLYFSFFHPTEVISWLQACRPAFALRHVRCEYGNLETEHYAKLMNCEMLQSVREIDFMFCIMNDEIAKCFAASPHLLRLQKLSFRRYYSPDRNSAKAILRDRFGKIDHPAS